MVSQQGTNRAYVRVEKGKPKPAQIKELYDMWMDPEGMKTEMQNIILSAVYAHDLCLCIQQDTFHQGYRNKS